MKFTRHFVDVGQRRVHDRRCGAYFPCIAPERLAIVHRALLRASAAREWCTARFAMEKTDGNS